MAEGNHIEAKVNQEYVRRLLLLNGRRLLREGALDFHNEVRRLEDEVPVATLDVNLEELYQDYLQGILTTVSVVVGDTTYSGTVASGASWTYSPETSCNTYENIQQVEKIGTEHPTYKVVSCGSGTGGVYRSTGRRLVEDGVDTGVPCDLDEDCGSADKYCVSDF